MVKNSCMTVWLISRILILCSARRLHTAAIMPTRSWPVTVTMARIAAPPFTFNSAIITETDKKATLFPSSYKMEKTRSPGQNCGFSRRKREVIELKVPIFPPAAHCQTGRARSDFGVNREITTRNGSISSDATAGIYRIPAAP